MGIRQFVEFSRDVLPRLVRHTGLPGLLMVLGVVQQVSGHTGGLAWVAFLLAAGAVLRRALDDTTREIRAEREARVEALLRERYGDEWALTPEREVR